MPYPLDDAQMLHIHVFFVDSPNARHMAEHRADQHQGRVSIRKRPYHADSAPDLAVQSLHLVVGADAHPVFTGKVEIGQCLLNAVLDLFGGFL